eukprot:TRINITY_DN3385_c0_g2_i1.p1 TRINITY_DN3385_c0_g2~~TRINITY_DN3385_c0_g2_i1.p1  ORF type:complete len:508 (+),score=39.52 TRINITY_DN3385_c0_g2_i1:124-1647(+)
MYVIGFPLALVAAVTVLVALASLPNVTASASIGMCWGRVSHQPIPPTQGVALLQANNITKLKLFNADPKVLSALSGSGIEVLVMVTNAQVVEVAANLSAAKSWVNNNVNLWLPAGVDIKYVSVGNELFLTNLQTADTSLRAAFDNIYAALVYYKIDSDVKVTTSFNAEILQNTSTPSESQFSTQWASDITHIAGVIYNTSSIFSINIYPFYNIYDGASDQLSADLIFFDRANTSSGSTYTNVFDASYDALVYALEKVNLPTVTIVIGEIGWPTDGDSHANTSWAQEFNRGMIARMLGGTGTKKRPNTVIDGYVFGLIDEDWKNIKPGAFERRWGLYTKYGQPKYAIDLTAAASMTATLANFDGIYYEASKWCVAKSGADTTNLTLALSKLCSGGNSSDYGDLADCTPVTYTGGYTSTGDACITPSTIQKHASYAMNEYYQVNGQNASYCDWYGTAEVVTTNPSYSNCYYRIGLDAAEMAAFTTSTGAFSGYVVLYTVGLILLLGAFL